MHGRPNSVAAKKRWGVNPNISWPHKAPNLRTNDWPIFWGTRGGFSPKKTAPELERFRICSLVSWVQNHHPFVLGKRGFPRNQPVMTWKRCGGWVSQNRRSFADGETPFFCSKLPVACFFTDQGRMKAPTKRYSSNMKDGKSQFRKNECNFQQDWPPLVINGVGTPINGRRWMGFPGLNFTSFFSGAIFSLLFSLVFGGPSCTKH